MKKHANREIVRLNGAAFRLPSEAARAGNIEILVEAALSRIVGGTVDMSCVQYNCNLYAPNEE